MGISTRITPAQLVSLTKQRQANARSKEILGKTDVQNIPLQVRGGRDKGKVVKRQKKAPADPI